MGATPSHLNHDHPQGERHKGHGGAHGHSHDHAHSHGPGTLLAVALALTSVFMVVEFTGGFLAGSLALIADAGHMLADAAALALALVAVRIASRPADQRRTFGYQRLRVLATFVNGCALLFLTAWIAIEAVQRFFTPAEVNGSVTLWIGAIGFAINLIVFGLLRRGDSHDMNIAAATLHVLSDLLGSVAAIVAGVVILYTSWTPIDPLLSLLVCLLIVRSAWALIRRSAHILMEGSPDNLDVNELRSTLERRIPAIRDVHHVHCWLVGPQETLLTMHASVAANTDHSRVLKEAKSVLAEHFGITHATIQIEADDCVDEDCGGKKAAGARP